LEKKERWERWEWRKICERRCSKSHM
jgi:hypothetical protein